MFASFRSKTFTILLILLLAVCPFVWATNNIPKGNSSSNSAGVFIVTRMDALKLNANGYSNFHYLSTSVGDTSLHYSDSAGKNDTKAYGKEMISSVITCFEGSTISMSLSMSLKHGTAGYTYIADPSYCLPYLLVVVRVSNFSSTHDASSSIYTDWLYDDNSACTYTVVAILDSRDPSKQSADNLSLEAGECFHLVMVPFSNSNLVYWEGANLVSTGDSNYADYTARYEATFTYSYTVSGSETKQTGFATDAMDTKVQILKNVEEFEALAFDTTTSLVSLTLSDLLENSNTTANKASSVIMAYEHLTDDANANMPERTLHVTVRPYSNLDEYYFIRSGASTIQANRNFVSYLKITNISSYCSSAGVKLNYTQNGNQTSLNVTNGTTYDTKTLGSTIDFELKTVVESITGTYKKKNSASLNFDVFPYVESLPSVLGGDYSMTIVAEFSID